MTYEPSNTAYISNSFKFILHYKGTLLLISSALDFKEV